MRERHTCTDCGKLSPPTETGYTLISKEFGWRLLRSVKPDGTFSLEWRCPACWQKRKQQAAPTPWESVVQAAQREPTRASNEDQSLTRSGEYSRMVYDEEFPPPSSRSRSAEPPPSGKGDAGPPSTRGTDRGLPRKKV